MQLRSGVAILSFLFLALLAGPPPLAAQGTDAIAACVSRLGTIRLVTAAAPCLPVEQRISLGIGPTGSVSGQVTSCDEQEDFTGRAVGVLGHSFTALTDAAGRFKISNVPVGTYDIGFPLYVFQPGEVTPPPVRAVVTAGADTSIPPISVTNLLGDADNCGSCGNVCAPGTNAYPWCRDGSCALSCQWGWGNCDGNDANGCETSTWTPENCGSCGHACPALPNATSVCNLIGTGTCSIGMCNTGFGNCDGNAENGCETATSNDPNNCGACGWPCPSGTCVNGMCQTPCGPGWADCNSMMPGCETNTLTDSSNCGGCGIMCTGGMICAAGVCQPGGGGGCMPPMADCNLSSSDGCETNLLTSFGNCGFCGNPCVGLAHTSTAVCSAGVCLGTMCEAGYLSCDGNMANGCEVNALNDPVNCGSCGQVCSSGTCTNGLCVGG